eukprot:scaffold1440_cov332-Pavlova_lutheri.AAC.27
MVCSSYRGLAPSVPSLLAHVESAFQLIGCLLFRHPKPISPHDAIPSCPTTHCADRHPRVIRLVKQTGYHLSPIEL